jgi:hypothetical protein
MSNESSEASHRDKYRPIIRREELMRFTTFVNKVATRARRILASTGSTEHEAPPAHVTINFNNPVVQHDRDIEEIVNQIRLYEQRSFRRSSQ